MKEKEGERILVRASILYYYRFVDSYALDKMEHSFKLAYHYVLSGLYVILFEIRRGGGGSQGQKQKFSLSSQLPTVAEICAPKIRRFHALTFSIGKEVKIEPQFKFLQCLIALQMLH